MRLGIYRRSDWRGLHELDAVEEPIEPESVCRVTFSGGVVLAESLVLKGKAKSVRRRREKSDSRSNSGGGGSDRSDHYC